MKKVGFTWLQEQLNIDSKIEQMEKTYHQVFEKNKPSRNSIYSSFS